MPKFFAQNLLTSPLDTPELPAGDQQGDFPDGYDPRDYYDPVQTLITWQAPSRPHRKRTRAFYTTVAILLLLVGGIAFLLLQDLFLIAVLLSFGFVVYVLNFVEPADVEYKLSTQGVTIGEHFHHWEELDSFWFIEKDGQKMLYILTKYNFPGVLILLLRDVDQEMIKRIVATYLPFHEIAPKSSLEKWADSLQKHFSLENPLR